MQEGVAAFCDFFQPLAKCQLPVTLTYRIWSTLTVTLPTKECEAELPKNWRTSLLQWSISACHTFKIPKLSLVLKHFSKLKSEPEERFYPGHWEKILIMTDAKPLCPSNLFYLKTGFLSTFLSQPSKIHRVKDCLPLTHCSIRDRSLQKDMLHCFKTISKVNATFRINFPLRESRQ